MKLALVTDLHANREAVEAVLEHAAAQGAGRYAFLGDYVGYGADPGWVVDTVAAHVARGAIAVRGNHDVGVAREPSPTMVPVAREVVRWTQSQLSSEQIAFRQNLPLHQVEGPRLFVHANAFGQQGWAYIRGRQNCAACRPRTADTPSAATLTSPCSTTCRAPARRATSRQCRGRRYPCRRTASGW